MNIKSIIKMAVIIFGILITFNVATFAQKNCFQLTDRDFAAFIYENLKPKYNDQLEHINIRTYAYDGVVVIEGYVLNKKDPQTIKKLVEKMECVNSVVVVRLKVGKGVGCGPGQQECGGSCISSKVECNVCLAKGGCEE